MLKQNQFWILSGLASLCVVLVLANIVLFVQNRQMQADINQRAQYIQRTAQLEPLYRDIVKALADLSVRNNDPQLRDVLSKQGITISTNPTPAVPAAPAAEAKKGAK